MDTGVRSKGRIVNWNDDKGFGFIAPFSDGPQVFLHIKAIQDGNRRPAVDDVITYTLTTDAQGRPRASRAVLAVGTSRKTGPRSGNTGRARGHAIPVGLAFLAAVSVSSLVTGLPLVVPLAYIVMSLVTFLAYGFDKSAAMNGRWRTSESMLHLLALAGGWPGALVARHTMRHKTIKQPFRTVFWATVLLNCAVLGWWHTDAGRAFLRAIT